MRNRHPSDEDRKDARPDQTALMWIGSCGVLLFAAGFATWSKTTVAEHFKRYGWPEHIEDNAMMARVPVEYTAWSNPFSTPLPLWAIPLAGLVLAAMAVMQRAKHTGIGWHAFFVPAMLAELYCLIYLFATVPDSSPALLARRAVAICEVARTWSVVVPEPLRLRSDR